MGDCYDGTAILYFGEIRKKKEYYKKKFLAGAKKIR